MDIQIVNRSGNKIFDIKKDHKHIGTLHMDHDTKTYRIYPSSSKISRMVRKIIPFDYNEDGSSSGQPSPKEKSQRDPVQKSGCIHDIRLDPKSIDILRSLSKDVFFMDSKGKKKVGKEFFGRLKIVPSSAGHLDLIYDHDSIVVGEKDGIDGFEDKVTYHTHPYPTYLEFDAKYAWPSVTDYKSILETILHGKGVLHIVVTVEGIYVVSLNEYWCNNIPALKSMVSKDDEKLGFYMEKLDIEYPFRSGKKSKTPHIQTPQDFCKHANKVGLNKMPVLHTQFIAWSPSMKFKVKSPIIGSSCKM